MKPHSKAAAFTLVELIVGMAIIVLMFSFLMAAMSQITRTMSSTTAKVEQFRGARDAFERVTTRLAQATLNTYTDYRYTTDNVGMKAPSYYERRSELRFLTAPAAEILAGVSASNPKIGHSVFFTAPLGGAKPDGPYFGLENLMNVAGFYVEYSLDTSYRPKFIGTEIPDRWRWRLMEFAPPTEDFILYRFTSGGTVESPNAVTYNQKTWIVENPDKFKGAVRPVAENVIALVLAPRLAREEEKAANGGQYLDKSPLAPQYRYDSTMAYNPGAVTGNAKLYSKNQLPPVVQVTMVVIDEKSAASLSLNANTGDMFGVSARFRDTSSFSRDLQAATDPTNSLEAQLIKRRVAYRIFTTNVHLRGSKWSQAEK